MISLDNNFGLSDNFGRKFPYLRLSLTDICNFKCRYCLPDGYKKPEKTYFMSFEEITRLVRAFAELGIWKIRLTGGEPVLRRDFLDIAKMISETKGIRRVALTTNGYKLPQMVNKIHKAGVSALNISIDSLKSQKFKDITGHDRLEEISKGLEMAMDAGFDAVKVNVVLMRGVNDVELPDFIEWVKDKKISLRFIELMRTGDNVEFFGKRHLSADILREILEKDDWSKIPRKEGSGPAIEYEHAQYEGTIGIIAPYSKDFCKSCNRLRVSAKGKLHLCLFGEGGYDLREFLQSDCQKEELQARILRLLRFKDESHYLHQNISGATPHFASIGG